ncbi:SMP-30/gluconolactonase/LRE family protein [Calycomorphotria hydatis]|uniref:Gluconolactonase n=1 Tax=Calycomorphotria hydatis TaxID=2528027 RepID=A0A517TAW2_9PLAN|nr:SMP-30/gluconolactonase/LRE family protein [Calycomorphotria hydatis]QDT65511.1 Gluconolactonase precursor [Calycomorphotria hydatis]
MRPTTSLLLAVISVAFNCFECASALAQEAVESRTIGEVIKLDDGLNRLISPDAQIEVLAEGFVWSEGPVWYMDDNGSSLLFSDVPENTIYRWREGAGLDVFMKPSGFTGISYDGKESGSNGLTLDAKGRLITCEHGDRRVSLLTVGGGKMTLADEYNGKRFNSPNDVAVKSNGDVYFTDPPYGLSGGVDGKFAELGYCGVYRISKDRSVTLLTKEFTRPNGICFSPDEKTLYVANSDPKANLWKALPVNDDGTLGESRLFFDATNVDPSLVGGADGLKADRDGNLFATGPGGVWIFSPDGTPLGRISTGERIANCAWGDDGTVLYMTSDMYLCRIKTLTKGDGWK